MKEAANPKREATPGWRAVVPASSANLGCAFDSAGLALNLHLKALFIPSDSAELTIEYHGQSPDRFPLDSSNLLLRALQLAAERLQKPVPAGRIVVESEIPIGVGLGSSAAAVVAGLLLGLRYSGQEVSADQLLRWAEELEGHIDNSAAAYHGGLVFALCNNIQRVVTPKVNFPEGIRLILVTPDIAVPTHAARKILPETYERADVIHTLQRTAALAATCFSGRFDLFPELFDDKLHHPYRQKLAPGIEQCLRLRLPGLLGTAISGSGSSVIAFANGNELEIAGKLQESFRDAGLSSEARFTHADNNGAWVTREPVPLAGRVGDVLQRAEKAK